MGTCEVAAEPRDLVQIMLQVPLLWRSLIRHGMVQQGKFGVRQRQCGWRVRLGTTDHRHPEHSPGKDAEQGDQICQALGGAELRFLSPAA